MPGASGDTGPKGILKFIPFICTWSNENALLFFDSLSSIIESHSGVHCTVVVRQRFSIFHSRDILQNEEPENSVSILHLL